jgi:hypothetical protein
MVMVIWFVPTALMLLTLLGNPPGTYAPQSVVPTACIMWIQNRTSWALTVSPLDHFQPFSVMVTWLPLYCGGLARLSFVFTVGEAPFPNQYSGRYMRYWKYSESTTLK